MNDIAKFFIDSIAENSGDIAVMKEKITALEAKVEKFTPTNNARDKILQALASGYCHPKNSSKVLDSDLIFAMADELAKLSPVA